MTFRHNTKIGQNFLTDKSIVDWMITRAKLSPGDRVLEIGAGSGILTRGILASGCESLDAIEIDERLKEYLEPVAASDTRLTLHWTDAVKFDYSALVTEPTHIISNLPYHITTPVIWRLLEGCSAGYMLVMTQEEAAERLSCGAGARSSNPLSVTIAAMGYATVVRKVSRTAFRPAPRVDSAIVEIISDARRGRLELPRDVTWRRLLSGSFAVRRKTLVNNWKTSFRMSRQQCVDVLSRHGMGEMSRGEELSLEGWLKLYSDEDLAQVTNIGGS
ncbi:MAG: 16S rRNA (adenine(1518)-N(6)/adenine(1519)-N(6))-dimethyltransferase RsmA [Synergistaceae bacterium]|nr:16S rRNA (adenine(1518)-N(6)/adenine(1519)-N(6))-dimethyltransferase RsmA [Synergistaceae bacterium]